MTSTTSQIFQEFVNNTYNYDFGETNLLYLSNGLGGEVGEVQNEVKKLYRAKYKKNTEEELNRKDNIKKELGDVLWYIFAISNELDISIDDIINSNIEKNQSNIKNT